MKSFQDRFGVKLYYLFYNPFAIPHQVKSPLRIIPETKPNIVGCRVIPKKDLDLAIKHNEKGYSLSYADLRFIADGDFMEDENSAGWRLEYFIADLMLECKEGMIDDSEHFADMQQLMRSKTAPMSVAVSITFDSPDIKLVE